MKRFSFIAALFGAAAAKAQQWKEVFREDKPALNNQCPVCGTMAEPYRRLFHADFLAPLVGCKPVEGTSYSVCDQSPRVTDDPKQRITRCPRCSNAFWQDAEDAK